LPTSVLDGAEEAHLASGSPRKQLIEGIEVVGELLIVCSPDRPDITGNEYYATAEPEAPGLASSDLTDCRRDVRGSQAHRDLPMAITALSNVIKDWLGDKQTYLRHELILRFTTPLGYALGTSSLWSSKACWIKIIA
jgi:hypothetical protein